jgi:hypothetical protein
MGRDCRDSRQRKGKRLQISILENIQYEMGTYATLTRHITWRAEPSAPVLLLVCGVEACWVSFMWTERHRRNRPNPARSR